MRRKQKNHTKSLFCTILTAAMLFCVVVGAGIATDGRVRTSAAASNGSALSFTTESGTFTISTVSELSAKGNGDDSIMLDWEAVAGATGYVVYSRNIDKNGSFELYKHATASGCVVNDLNSGTAYEFKVAAYVTVNDEKYEGNSQTVKAVTAPKAVKLTASDEGSEIKLKWSESGSVTGYEIYKSSDGSNYTLIETISGDTTSYTDSDTQGGEYFYKVRALRTFDGTDYYSDYASTSVTDESQNEDEESSTVELEAPTFSLSTSSDGSLSISWNETGDNPDGYEIKYSSYSSGSYTTLAIVTDTSYTTDELASGSTYYFKVYAYKYNGSEKYTSSSEIASITIGGETTVSEQADDNSYDTSSDSSGSGGSSGSASDSYNSDNGDTYIKISIDEQHMWFYKNGELLVSTDVVTGTLGVNDTPRGTYSIISKQSPAVLMEDSHVTYWMPFTYSGCGIHDAWWRYGEFGGDIYKTSGSHGCVNTPYDEVEIIYNNVSVGTTVIVE